MSGVGIVPEVKLKLCINNGHNLALKLDNVSTDNNYNRLANKPSINGVTVQGDYDGEHYRLQDKMNEITEQEIDRIIFGG